MSIPFYFLSDVHLGAGGPELERLKLLKLKKLFAVISDRPGPLYILGDLFDFWFEYRDVIQSEHFEVLAEMLKLRQSGVEITLLAGNHDYWTGPFLEKQLGIKTFKDDLTIDLNGQKVLLCHGDGLDQTDWGYRALKAVLRNHLSIKAFSLIHPGLAVSFAHWFSRFSRNHLTRHKYVDQAPLERQAARLYALGYRAVVFGHTHQPALKDMEGRVFLNLGDFFKNFTYGVYRDGKFILEKVDN